MVVVVVVVVVLVVVVICENTSTCFSVVGTSGSRPGRGRAGRGCDGGRGDLRKHINLLQCCGYFRR